ncbi:MAG: CHAT domain-containing protein [Cyanobacteria bacterium J06634_6]
MKKRLQQWTLRAARLCVFPVTWIAGVAAALSPAAQSSASAQVVPTAEGSGTTVTETGDQYDIAGGTQAGGNLFHEFDEFSLAESQTANFTSDSGVFNIVGQVSSAAPSYIDGTVQVSGSDANLYLVNPSGVLFGPNAQLSLGGSFTATTADQVEFNGEVLNVLEQPTDYAALNTDPSALHFTQDDASPVVNQGELSVDAGESLSLVGGSVVNTGRLEAPSGEIGLVAVGGNSTVTLATPGSLLSMEVNAAEFEMDLNGNDGLEATALPVLLTGGASQSAESLTVNDDGSVTLGGSALAEEFVVESGTVAVTGDVSVNSDADTGGSVVLVGESVAVVEGQIEASGTTGGTVRIGGDYRGEGALPVAQTVVVDEASVVAANGTEAAGGSVVVFAEEEAVVQGSLSATGATEGGLVETSANYLTTAGIDVDTSGETAGGQWLVDPVDVEVVSTASGPNQIEASAIESQIDGGSTFTLETSGAGTGFGDISLLTSINQTDASSSGGLILRGRRFEDNNHKINLASSGELLFDINAVNSESNPTSESIQNAVDAIGTVNGNRLIRLGSGDYGFNSAVTLDTNVEISGQGPLSTQLTTLLAGTKIFRVGAGVEASVSGLTLTTSGLGANDVGGGIVNLGGLLTVNDTRFVDNRAYQNGGAIDSFAGGIVTVRNSEFINNRSAANGSGGAIHIGNSNGVSRISNTLFQGNSSVNSGGAINVGNASVIVDDEGGASRFVDNSAQYGGAVRFNGTSSNTAEFDSVVFEDNTASDLAGALYLGSDSTTTINNNTFTGNQARTGGAIATFAPSVTDTGSVFTANQATNGGDGGALYVGSTGDFDATGSSFVDNTATGTGSSGGAIAVFQEAISLTDVTLTNNSSINGGGISAWDGATVDLDNTTLDLNRATLVGSGVGQGGGIWASNSTLNISNNSLFDNNIAASAGGGIFLSGSSGIANISGTTFNRNISQYGGGILANDATLNISASSVFDGNQATVEDGGGIAVLSGVANISGGTLFESNGAFNDGGGISIDFGSTATIEDSRFVSNSVTDDGGGIYVSEVSTATVNTVELSNNTAVDNGGGLYVSLDSRAVLSAVEVTGNTASNDGGGLVVASDSTVIVEDSRFANNTAGDDGGGIYVSTASTATIDTVEVSNNTAIDGGGGLYVSVGSTATFTDVDVSSNTARVGGGLRTLNSDVTVASSEAAPLAGRFTRNQAVRRSSTQPIDSGDPTVAAGGGIEQTGGTLMISNVRIARNEAEGDGGGLAINGDATTVVDRQTEYLVNQAEGNGGGISTYSTGTLTIDDIRVRENHADLSGGGIFEESAALVSISDTTILTNTADGDGGGLSVGGGGTVTFDNGGIGDNVAQQDGGAIAIRDNDQVSITSASISDNTAVNGVGGAIVNDNTTGTGSFAITNSSLDNNTATEGGAIYTTANSLSTIFSAGIDDNEATDGDGGALYIGNNATVTIEQVGLRRNEADDQGGAIYYDADRPLVIDNVTFESNLADSDGGAIANNSDSATLSIADTDFLTNITQEEGGALFAGADTNTVVNSSNFQGNRAEGAASNGGAIAVNRTGELSLADTNLINNYATRAGGGIFLRDDSEATVSGTLTLDAEGRALTSTSRFEGNNTSATDGGGISASNRSQVTVENILFENNSAGDDGGAIAVTDSGKATITNSNFENNHANDGGGGVYSNTVDLNATSSSAITVTDSRFIANNADREGGGLLQGQLGTATVVRTTFRANEASSTGGGLHVRATGTLSVSASTLEGNQATTGGGLSNQGNSELVNTTVSGNIASGAGGAVYNSGTAASLNVRSSTITNNQSGRQAGGIAEASSQLVRLQNTIVARNTGATDDVSGQFSDGGNNLIGTSSGASGFASSAFVGTNTNKLDPKLAPLADNGGSTRTHLLLADSLAINTGGATNLPTFDQRGRARVTGSAVDIGAVELTAAESPALSAGEAIASYLNSPDPTLSATTFGDLDLLLANRTDYDLNASSRAIRRVERSFSQGFEDYWDLSAGPDMTFDDVQAILRRAQEEYKVNSAVIYAVFVPEDADESESNILRVDPTPEDDDLLNLAVVLPEGELVSYELPVTRREANRQVRYFRSAVSDPEDARSYQPLSQQMYQWLLAPIEEDLAAQNIQNLMYALDDGLRTAPITAMRDYNGFSLERYGISVVPSMGLMQADFPVSVRRATVAMGVSEFDTQSPLPAVPIELEVVDRFVPVSQTVLNEATTLEAIKNVQALEQPGVLHLATHANFDRRTPEESSIQLWNEPLSMKAFSELGWGESDLELLILSACSTAMSSRNAELGFAGLAAASGVDATVGSLWEVSDVGTLALMSEFYAQLEETDLRFEALRRAQLALLNGETRIEGGNLVSSHGEVDLPDEWDLPDSAALDHPFFWSAFTMVGNPW